VSFTNTSIKCAEREYTNDWTFIRLIKKTDVQPYISCEHEEEQKQPEKLRHSDKHIKKE
jgi:hypothetical protein